MYNPENGPPVNQDEIDQNVERMIRNETFWSRRPIATEHDFIFPADRRLERWPKDQLAYIQKNLDISGPESSEVVEDLGVNTAKTNYSIIRRGIYNDEAVEHGIPLHIDTGAEYDEDWNVVRTEVPVAIALAVADEEGQQGITYAEGLVREAASTEFTYRVELLEGNIDTMETLGKWVVLPRGSAHKAPEPNYKHRTLGRVTLFSDYYPDESAEIPPEIDLAA